MIRHDIQFESHGLQCAGWFFRAADTSLAPRPCIVMAHGLAGVKEMRLDAYAELFAAAGYHALVFDYRHFGDSAGEPRQLLDLGKQLQDWHAAITYARSLPRVEPDGIVLWGSSLSGGHVIRVAAEEPHLAAVISQVPHVDGWASALAMGLPLLVRLTWHGLADQLRALLGQPAHYIPVSGEPGQLAMMTGPGEARAFARLLPNNHRVDQRIAARIALRVASYSPGKHLPQLRMPCLLQVGEQDITTPPEPVLKACARAPRVTLRSYPCGHFEPYVEPMFSRVVDDQLNFLTSVFASAA